LAVKALLLFHASATVLLVHDVRALSPAKVLSILVTLTTFHLLSPIPRNLSVFWKAPRIFTSLAVSHPLTSTFIAFASEKAKSMLATLAVFHVSSPDPTNLLSPPSALNVLLSVVTSAVSQEPKPVPTNVDVA